MRTVPGKQSQGSLRHRNSTIRGIMFLWTLAQIIGVSEGIHWGRFSTVWNGIYRLCQKPSLLVTIIITTFFSYINSIISGEISGCVHSSSFFCHWHIVAVCSVYLFLINSPTSTEQISNLDFNVYCKPWDTDIGSSYFLGWRLDVEYIIRTLFLWEVSLKLGVQELFLDG